MGSKNKTIINVLTSGGQVALIGVVYYFLYKFLLTELGVKRLGVWSVVMSASSVANIADLGIATSMVRFVSLYEHENKLKNIPKLIFTGVILNLIIFVPICFIIWPTAYFILGNIVEGEYVELARQLLPFSLICVLLNSLAGVYGSLLDGFRKNYIRNSIFTFSSIVFLLLSIYCVKIYGLIGVVWAQVFQSFLSLLLCIIVSVKILKYNPLKFNWDTSIFKEIFSYGVKFQLTSITGILNEPVTKMLLSNFGGLAFAGYYEMANKLVMQIRGVIVSANQSLMPLLVKESVSHADEKKYSILNISFAGVFLISLLFLGGINIISPFISEIWIGHNEPIFINVLLLVSACMFINLLSAPVYFALLSRDKLMPIIISQTLMAAINVGLGFLLGNLFQGYGIVITWMVVVITGSIYLIKSIGLEETTRMISDYKITLLLLISLTLFCIFIAKIDSLYMYVLFVIYYITAILISYFRLFKKIDFNN